MASAAVTRWKEQIDRQKGTIKRANERLKNQRYIDLAVGSIAAYGIAKIEESAGELPTVGDLDGKFVWGGVAAVVALNVPGKMGRALGAAADGLLIAACYQAGRGS